MKLSTILSCGLLTFVSALAMLSALPQLAHYAWVSLILSCALTALCSCVSELRKTSVPLLIGVLLWSVTLALFRVAALEPALQKDIVSERIELTARVLGMERREEGYLVRMRRVSPKPNLVAKNTCMTLLAKTMTALELRYGDTVMLTGMIEPLERESYGNYLRSQGMECTMENVRVRLVRSGSSWNPLRILEGMRLKTESTITKLYPEPDASLVTGLLTGSRGMIPKNLQADFKTGGLTHILAISGYNITMILLLLSSAFCWLPLRVRVLVCALALIAFTLFTGASASVVRASIMGLLGLLALSTGREQILRLSMLWTLAGMALWNPMQLWWDSGLHLSFLALAGLMEFSELIAPWTKKVLPKGMGIEESVRTTLAAQVLTSPWILFAFERLSIISPLSNLLVLPAIPFAMATGCIATVLGMFWQPLGSVAALTTLPFTRWIIGVTEVIAKIPGASIDWQPGLLWILVSYGVIAFWKYRNQNL